MERSGIIKLMKYFLKQNISTIIALLAVASVGIGASYLIIRVSNATDFSYISTGDSIIFTAEISKSGVDVDIEGE